MGSDLMRSLEVMQAMVQVRNTFINIDENTPVDSRIIQSLPRNMFRQSVLAESSKVNLANCLPEVESEECPKDVAPEAKPYPSLSPGAFVVIEGLVKLPACQDQGRESSSGLAQLSSLSQDLRSSAESANRVPTTLHECMQNARIHSPCLYSFVLP